MTRALPLLPTLFVTAAVAVMVALGVWQLGRMQEKEALLESARAALGNDAVVDFPTDTLASEQLLYRKTTLVCERVLDILPRAGTSAAGAKGWAQRASCRIAGAAQPVDVDLGWSLRPDPVEWRGGPVEGVIAPGRRVVATQGLAGLEPLAAPDPSSIPNNHLAYAGQWFFFAFTALVIYILALRRRSAARRGS